MKTIPMNIRSRNEWLNVRALGVVLIILCMEVGLRAATIKKKNGEVVEGKINGLVVQKSEVKKVTENGTTKYTVNYDLTNGADIKSIGEEGVVRKGNGFLFLTASQETPIDDVDALEAGLEATPQKGLLFGWGAMKGGGGVSRVGGRMEMARDSSAYPVIGEFRTEGGRPQLLPFLVVKTAKGEVQVPVAEIIDFHRKAGEPRER